MDYGKKITEIYDTKKFEPCTAKDFDLDAKSREYYTESYQFFPILCIHPTSEIYLEGSDSTSFRKTIYVTVEKCVNSTQIICKSDDEIIQFVNRLHVNVYSITQKVDFEKYGQRPMYTKIKKEFELYSKADSENVVSLNFRQNEVETEDSFFSLGFNGVKHYTFYDIDYKRMTNKPYNDHDTYFSAEIFMDETIIMHSR